MLRKGFTGEAFVSSEKISRKWRYIFTQYTRVKDNNGRTGRGRAKFKYYDIMHAIFIDNNAGGVLTDPQIVNGENDIPILNQRKHQSNTGNTKKSYQQTMIEITNEYHKKSLQMQQEAIELEKRKVDLLQQLLNHS